RLALRVFGAVLDGPHFHQVIPTGGCQSFSTHAESQPIHLFSILPMGELLQLRTVEPEQVNHAGFAFGLGGSNDGQFRVDGGCQKPGWARCLGQLASGDNIPDLEEASFAVVVKTCSNEGLAVGGESDTAHVGFSDLELVQFAPCACVPDPSGVVISAGGE